MKILAIIPARSGSKGIPNKNIRILNGKPMLAYTIGHALDSKLINRTIVSTDSERYAEIARSYGAETPFIRPSEFASDQSLDIDVFYHALTWLKENEGYTPDVCVHLRPCYPIREAKTVDKIIKKLIDNTEFDAVRSVVRNSEIPYKMWRLSEDNKLIPVVSDFPECYDMPRQLLPLTYSHCSYADAIRANVILEKRSMTGSNVGGYIVEENFDIDEEQDYRLAEKCMSIRDKSVSFLVDSDSIFAFEDAQMMNLDIIEKLHDRGHKVFIRCPDGIKKEEILKQGISENAIVTEFIETDYYISKKSMDIEKLKKII